MLKSVAAATGALSTALVAHLALADATLRAPDPGLEGPVSASLDRPSLYVALASVGGRVISDPPGIDCGSTCRADFDPGSEVTLYASSETGVSFNGWTGACSSTAPCRSTLTRDTAVIAAFGDTLPEDSLVLQQSTLDGTASHRAEGVILAGPDLTVGSTGELTLSAGRSITFLPGFQVLHGGGFFAASDPPEGDWYRPGIGISWHWQLDGEINTTYAVDLYDIDLFEVSSQEIAALQATGKKVICYFSAGSYEPWRDDADAFPQSVLGNPVGGWDEERWLDIRSPAVRQIMADRLDIAQKKGCDAVEPDNVDAYENASGFALTKAEQLDYDRWLADAAHARSLAVAQKNAIDLAFDLTRYFDLAINESCFEYDECNSLAPYIKAGKPVLNVEYSRVLVTDPAARQELCEEAESRGFSTLILPIELDDRFRIACPTPTPR